MPNLLIFRILDRVCRSHLAIAAVLSFACLSARAQSTIDVVSLASACLNCHAATRSVNPVASSSEAIPAIAGQSQQVLTGKLLAFKSDSPPEGTTIMNRIAKGYSDEELASIAGYFSRQSPVASNVAGGDKK